MSLAPLNAFIPKYITNNTKVKIRVGTIFKLAKQPYEKHSYWGPFFKKYPENSIVTIKELLAYPELATPEWILNYKDKGKLSFKETTTSKTILVGCSFGLMDLGTKGKPQFERPDYLYLEVQK